MLLRPIRLLHTLIIDLNIQKIQNEKVEKYLLPAVRIQNPARLRRCNSLPHPSSLPPPFWMSWEANEGGGGSSAFYIEGGAGEPAAPCRAAGSPPLYKRLLPLAPHLLPTTSREGEGERRGEGGSCNGEALPNIGSEPQVINISQLSQSKFFVCLIL